MNKIYPHILTKITYLLAFVLFTAANSFAQTVIFQSGFEAADPVFTGSAGANCIISQPIASNPNTGTNSGKMVATANNTSFSGSIITGSTISFVSGRYYTIDVYAKVSGATSTLKIGKTATATNAAMVALTGGDQLLWPGSANVTLTTYSKFTVTFLASVTESKYVGFQVVSGAAGGSLSTIYIDDVAITENINVPPGYFCTPTGNLTCTSNDYISNVTINTLNNTTTCGTGGYTVFAPTGSQTTSGYQGCSYILSLSVGAGTGTHGAGVWIDFDHSGTYDVGEFTLISNSISPSTTTTISITIPGTAVTGLTCMRVRYAYNLTVTSGMACTTGAGTYGETEDYQITILPAILPTCASNFSPASGAALSSCSGLTATLTWNAPPECVDNYKVYFDQNPSPTTLVSTQAGTSYTTGALTNGQTYYWKIVPNNTAGDAIGCTVQSFSISATIVAPTAPNVTNCNNPWSFNLNASGGSYPNYLWWSASTGGTYLGNGAQYTTPSLTASTTYYVEDAILSAEANVASTPAAGNCSSTASAFAFTVLNNSAQNLFITQLAPRFITTGTYTQKFNVYYQSGTHVAAADMKSSTNWIPNGSYNVTVSSNATPTQVPISNILIPAGQTYSIYFILIGSGVYTANTAPAAITSADGNLTIFSGGNCSMECAISPDADFSNSGSWFSNPFYGTVYYQTESCASTRTACQAIINPAYVGAGTYGIYAPGGTATVTDCEIYNGASTGCSSAICKVCTPASTGYSNVLISYMSLINSGDGTNNYTNCTGMNLNMVTAVGSPDWTGSAAPLTGAGSPKTVSYTTIGRKTVNLTPSVSNTVTIFSENFEGAASGWTGQATSQPSVNQNYWAMGTTSTAKAGWFNFTNVAGVCGATDGVLTGSYSPRVFNFQSGFPFSYNYCDYNVAAVATSNLRLISPAFSTTGYTSLTLTFNYVGAMNASDNVQLQYKIGAGAWTSIAGELYNNSITSTTLRTVTLPAACDNQAVVYLGWNFNCTTAATSAPPSFIIDDILVAKVIAVSNVYTDFNNMLMTAPSSGSITGVTPLCSNVSGTFGSSVAGTPGFTYSWTVTNPASGTNTVATPTASSSAITFTNSSASAITFTVSLAVTSLCCGLLPAPTSFTVSVNPTPVAPTAAASPNPLCPGATSTLTATAPASTTFQWYNAAAGGTLLSSNTSYAVTPSVTTDYYVQATSAVGCPGPRTLVEVTVTPTAAPTATGGTICGSGTAIVSVNSPVATYTYNFYTGSCGGTLVQSSTSSIYSAPIVTTTTYYISATAPGGCAVSACGTATVTVNVPGNPIDWLGVNTNGGTNLNTWFIGANWAGGCIPTCADNVRINPNGGSIVCQPDIGFNVTNAACNDMNLQAGCVLSFSDTKAELDVCGNFTHAGIFKTNYSTLGFSLGKVVFMGTTAQSYINSNANSIANNFFNDVIINNTAASPNDKVSLSQNNMTLGTGGTFTFQKGRLYTLSTNTLVITNTSPTSMSGYSATTGYVCGTATGNGLLERYIQAPALLGSYDFPVGLDWGGSPHYERDSIDFQVAPTTALTWLCANFNRYPGAAPIGPAANDPSCNATFNNQALDNGFWTIKANNSFNNTGLYNMTLFNTGYTNVSGNDWTIMTEHNGSATWGLLNGDGTNGMCGVVPVTFVWRGNMNGFSNFATAQSPVPLPVELLSFKAVYNGKSADVTWVTASEINCSYFSVEKSLDGVHFKFLKKVSTKAPGGNSTSTLNYAINDADVTATGTYYYRLKQYDNNGIFKPSPIAQLTIGSGANADDIFTVKPNPTTETAEVSYQCNSAESATLKVYDDRGRLVISKEMTCQKGLNTIIVDLNEHTEGMYFIVLSVNDNVYKTKLVKVSPGK